MCRDVCGCACEHAVPFVERFAHVFARLDQRGDIVLDCVELALTDPRAVFYGRCPWSM